MFMTIFLFSIYLDEYHIVLVEPGTIIRFYVHQMIQMSASGIPFSAVHCKLMTGDI